MNFRRFLNTVPKPVKVGSIALLVCAPVVGGIVGFERSAVEAPGWGVGVGLLAGALLGTAIALWVLCLGFVYADARRRNMPPVLWTLVAALIPNLLGFLLYFAIRRPLETPCSQCGRPAAVGQPFCSWCGRHEPAKPGEAATA